MAVCAGAATCWTSPWPCTVCTSPPVTCWTNSPLYILQREAITAISTTDRRFKESSGQYWAPECNIWSDQWLCCVQLSFWLSTATGDRARTRLTMQPVAVSVKCDRQVAAHVYSCCQILETFYNSVCANSLHVANAFNNRESINILYLVSFKMFDSVSFIFPTSHLQKKKHVFYAVTWVKGL